MHSNMSGDQDGADPETVLSRSDPGGKGRCLSINIKTNKNESPDLAVRAGMRALTIANSGSPFLRQPARRRSEDERLHNWPRRKSQANGDNRERTS